MIPTVPVFPPVRTPCAPRSPRIASRHRVAAIDPDAPTFRRGARAGVRALALGLLLGAALGGCTSDTTDTAGAPSAPGTPTPPPVDPGTPLPSVPGAGAFTLALPQGPVPLVEGGEAVAVRIALARDAAHTLPVTLAAEGVGTTDDELVRTFDNVRLAPGQNEATLSVALPIGTLPLAAGETRTLRVVATDGTNAPREARLEFAVTPTSRPDVYLLAGQSNMVGSSEDGARMAGPGEPDALDPRILQLNVTSNDGNDFTSPAAFTDPASIARAPLLIPALDPLHEPAIDADGTKVDGRIGLGLSFAKSALQSTVADIVLVPTAWSDTGFCKRGTNRFPGSGWSPAPLASDAFAGTLLFDRAVARTELALTESRGVLRGILWHQGEADSDDPECAQRYADNLQAMVAALRAALAQEGRTADAVVPFVLGTMSKGDAPGSSVLPFSDMKEIVDAVHRGVAGLVPNAAFVNADDLVPPAYPCGQGFCIHFGAAALREMGARYHARLLEAASGS